MSAILTFFLLCPLPVFVNDTHTWDRHDKQVYESIIKRCNGSDGYCLSYFQKKTDRHYNVWCDHKKKETQ